MADDEPRLQVHLAPTEPIEIGELTRALGSLGRLYQDFALANELARKPSDARLLVSTVAPGSIDISLLPDWSAVLAATPLLIPLFHKAELITKFALSIKALLDRFRKKDDALLPDNATVHDCDNAINIMKPIAAHGGSQTFNTINGGVNYNVFHINASEAADLLEFAV